MHKEFNEIGPSPIDSEKLELRQVVPESVSATEVIFVIRLN